MGQSLPTAGPNLKNKTTTKKTLHHLGEMCLSLGKERASLDTVLLERTEVEIFQFTQPSTPFLPWDQSSLFLSSVESAEARADWAVLTSSWGQKGRICTTLEGAGTEFWGGRYVLRKWQGHLVLKIKGRSGEKAGVRKWGSIDMLKPTQRAPVPMSYRDMNYLT